jgi:hypothetical protein
MAEANICGEGVGSKAGGALLSSSYGWMVYTRPAEWP